MLFLCPKVPVSILFVFLAGINRLSLLCKMLIFILAIISFESLIKVTDIDWVQSYHLSFLINTFVCHWNTFFSFLTMYITLSIIFVLTVSLSKMSGWGNSD